MVTYEYTFEYTFQYTFQYTFEYTFQYTFDYTFEDTFEYTFAYIVRAYLPVAHHLVERGLEGVLPAGAVGDVLEVRHELRAALGQQRLHGVLLWVELDAGHVAHLDPVPPAQPGVRHRPDQRHHLAQPLRLRQYTPQPYLALDILYIDAQAYTDI
eukprot:1177194-Prorocentrum_minimum.AAC.2